MPVAFEGAEGFGRNATGARGAGSQQVYRVTNLNNAGAGSFRDATSTQGNIVVFTVSGRIDLDSRVTLANNITILGETAPGPGIMISGHEVECGNNVILRFLRFRRGSTKEVDSLQVLSGSQNVIVDHCSVGWTGDEQFSLNGFWYEGYSTALIEDVTAQDCLISEGFQPGAEFQGTGLLLNDYVEDITFLRMLTHYVRDRLPLCKNSLDRVEIIECMAGAGNKGAGRMSLQYDGNTDPDTQPCKIHYKKCYSYRDHGLDIFTSGGESNWVSGSEIWVTGCYSTDRPGSGPEYDWTNRTTGSQSNLVNQTSAIFTESGVTEQANVFDARRNVVQSVGMLPYGDRVDNRGVQGFLDEDTTYPLLTSVNDAGGYPDYTGGSYETDSDNDGIPDYWEAANNPGAATAINGATGYMWIEEYSHHRASLLLTGLRRIGPWRKGNVCEQIGGSDRALVVTCLDNDGSNAAPVQYGGQTLTTVVNINIGSDRLYMGYLLESGINAASNQTVVTNGAQDAIRSAFFVNVDQENPIADSDSKTENNTDDVITGTKSMSVTTQRCAILQLMSGDAGEDVQTIPTNFVRQLDNDSGFSDLLCEFRRPEQDKSITMSATWFSNQTARLMGAMVINSSTAPASPQTEVSRGLDRAVLRNTRM